MQERGLKPATTFNNSAKDFFYALKDFFIYRLIFGFKCRGELSQQLLLFTGKLGWNHDIERNKQIAAGRTAAFGNTSSFDAERRARLRSGGNRQLFFSCFQG